MGWRSTGSACGRYKKRRGRGEVGLMKPGISSGHAPAPSALLSTDQAANGCQRLPTAANGCQRLPTAANGSRVDRRLGEVGDPAGSLALEQHGVGTPHPTSYRGQSHSKPGPIHVRNRAFIPHDPTTHGHVEFASTGPVTATFKAAEREPQASRRAPIMPNPASFRFSSKTTQLSQPGLNAHHYIGNR